MLVSAEASVVKNAGSHFYLSPLPKWQAFPAVLRGRIRLKGIDATNPIAVGDRVRYEVELSEGEDISDISLDRPAQIIEILSRKNYLIRRSSNLSKQSHIIAANIDMVYVVVSLYFPQLKLPFLDRILLTCQVYDLPVTIVLNKIDLYKEQAKDYVEDFKKIYSSASYPIIECSAHTGEGLDLLRESSRSKLCLFTGESGVGKSSLIKALDPSQELKIAKISKSHLRGKHTTSLYEMYRLDYGAYIVDSPGIRAFGLVDIAKEEIALHFPEMFKYAKDCKFSPCTHTHEPGCAVKEALDEGKISAERYNSYLGMLEEDGKFR